MGLCRGSPKPVMPKPSLRSPKWGGLHKQGLSRVKDELDLEDRVRWVSPGRVDGPAITRPGIPSHCDGACVVGGEVDRVTGVVRDGISRHCGAVGGGEVNPATAVVRDGVAGDGHAVCVLVELNAVATVVVDRIVRHK